MVIRRGICTFFHSGTTGTGTDILSKRLYTRLINSCRFRPAMRGPYCSSGPTRKLFFICCIMLQTDRFAAALSKGETTPIFVDTNLKGAYMSRKKYY